MLKPLLFIIGKFRTRWFYNNSFFSKKSTIGKAEFILAAFAASFGVSMNLVSLD